jgi:hypothetical protein
MARPRVANGGGGLPIQKLGMEYVVDMEGSPSAWGLGGGLTTSHGKNKKKLVAICYTGHSKWVEYISSWSMLTMLIYWTKT